MAETTRPALAPPDVDRASASQPRLLFNPLIRKLGAAVSSVGLMLPAAPALADDHERDGVFGPVTAPLVAQPRGEIESQPADNPNCQSESLYAYSPPYDGRLPDAISVIRQGQEDIKANLQPVDPAKGGVDFKDPALLSRIAQGQYLAHETTSLSVTKLSANSIQIVAKERQNLYKISLAEAYVMEHYDGYNGAPAVDIKKACKEYDFVISRDYVTKNKEFVKAITYKGKLRRKKAVAASKLTEMPHLPENIFASVDSPQLKEESSSDPRLANGSSLLGDNLLQHTVLTFKGKRMPKTFRLQVAESYGPASIGVGNVSGTSKTLWGNFTSKKLRKNKPITKYRPLSVNSAQPTSKAKSVKTSPK